jgi:hypothetical protein
MSSFFSAPNRTLCNVLEEMRSCYETRNFSYIKGLIEEAQYMGNSMEAALWDQKDFKRASIEYKKIKVKIKKAEKKLKKLEKNNE